MIRPVVWGLTGKYCAGKNRAAALLKKAGCPVVDVDKLGHQALEMKKEEVLRRFGKDVLDQRGLIDRRSLGKKVFGHPQNLQFLEAIVHPWVIEESRRLIACHPGDFLVINAALLFPAGMHRLCSKVIWIYAPYAPEFAGPIGGIASPTGKSSKEFGLSGNSLLNPGSRMSI